VANDKTRELLTPVPQILREAGHPERAEALEAVLAPGGWKALQQEGVFTTNVPLTIRASLRKAIEEASEKSPKTQNLSRLVAEGYEAVLDGSWVPPKALGPRPMAPGDSRVVLNVTLDDALRRRLRGEFARLKDELGYKVTEGGTAVAYLRHRLGITDEVLDSYVKRLAP
jgi:hypothetical protein